MISLDNLTVSYGGWTLFDGISFLINPKDRIGLVGRNGAGKTTLLRLIVGEQQPTSGAVTLNGECTVGYLPQQMKVADTTTLYAETEAAFGEVIDLEKEIAAGNFREDLYFRLSVFRIHLPSLRERPGDIAGYIRVFAAQFADKMGRRIDSIDADYIAALERHTWHGNVRELRNAVERSMIMADGNRLTADCLAPEFHAAAGSADPDSLALDDLERRHILRVLEHTRGNKAEAARLLGIGIATLYRKLDGYGVK